jgi:hypothetical protein
MFRPKDPTLVSALVIRIIVGVVNLGVSARPVVAIVRRNKIAFEFSAVRVVVVIWQRLSRLLVVIILIILVRLPRSMVVAVRRLVADWAQRLQNKFQLGLALFCMTNPALVIVNVLL